MDASRQIPRLVCRRAGLEGAAVQVHAQIGPRIHLDGGGVLRRRDVVRKGGVGEPRLDVLARHDQPAAQVGLVGLQVGFYFSVFSRFF